MAKPSMARVYSRWLGGDDWFPADRKLADELAARYPTAPIVARENRQFIGRAVRYVAERGIVQYLDVGAGPAAAEPSVHGEARKVHPGARVVFVDSDSAALIGNLHALDGIGGVRAVSGDLTAPEAILGDPEVAELIDLSQPLGLVLGSVLHFVTPSVARESVGRFVAALPSGSYVIMSVGVGASEVVDDFSQTYTPGRIYHHTREQIVSLFDGVEITSSGLAEAKAWGLGDEDSAREGTVLAGVGRKR